MWYNLGNFHEEQYAKRQMGENANKKSAIQNINSLFSFAILRVKNKYEIQFRKFAHLQIVLFSNPFIQPKLQRHSQSH